MHKKYWKLAQQQTEVKARLASNHNLKPAHTLIIQISFDLESKIFDREVIG
jgi:hypothetical protein